MNAPLMPPLYTARLHASDAQCDAWGDQPLLNALESGGIAWPSSCRNGTCRSCIGLLTEGRVAYRIDWPGVSLDEKREGWILPCAAYPMSDLVLELPL